MAKTKLRPANETADDDVKKWKEQIELAERERAPWIKRCDKIIKRYRDEREVESESRRRINLLWSNIETLRPSLYGRQPVPIVERRFLDSDPIGKIGSQILERSLRYDLEDSDFHNSVKMAVLDYLLVGRGIVWLRYDPLFGSIEDSKTGGEETGETPEADASKTAHADAASERQENPQETARDEQKEDAEQILDEHVCIDYVHWRDFFTFPSRARTWDEVEAVARRSYMSRDQLVNRFGNKIGKAVPLDHTPTGTVGQGVSEDLSKATVYEIWCITDKKVRFLAKEYGKLLEVEDDPLGIGSFWPCPRPLFGTLTNESLIPVPDYIEYQDQAIELDDLTQRISRLTAALKVAGAYDASAPGLQRLLSEDCENELIAVNSWAAFAEKGGLKGAISFLPIEETASVLGKLYEARSQIKQDLYEITGISDIIRGNSDPDETAKAQAIKGRFATMRLQERQAEVAKFCREIICLQGEIIAEHFSPETLIMSSGILYEEGVGPEIPPMPEQPQAPQVQPGMPMMPDQATQYQQAVMLYQEQTQKIQELQAEKDKLIADAIALLRQDKLRGFRIDIETEKVIADDVEGDRESRIGFITAVSGFIEKAMVAGQQNPDLIPLLTKTLMFGIRGFRVGRDLENAFEDFSDKAEKAVRDAEKNPQAQPPHPDVLKAQAAATKAQAEIQRAQIEAKSEQDNAQINMQVKNIEAQLASQKAQQDAQLEQMRHQFKMRELAMAHNGKTDEELASEQAKMMAEEQRKQNHEQMLANLHTGLQSLNQGHIQATAQTQAALQNTNALVAGIAQHIAAPSEIMRDNSGRAIGVRKGNRTMAIRRDQAGRAISLQ